MKYIFWPVCILCALPFAGPTSANEIGWQEAVTRLNAERSKITSCVAQLRTYGDATAIKNGALDYGKAKSAMDAVLAGLLDALEQNETGQGLAELETKLKASIEKRMAFCGTVEARIPETAGEKNIFSDVMKDTIKPSIAAVRAIFSERWADALKRKTMETQLEAATWPEFSKIRSARAP